VIIKKITWRYVILLSLPIILIILPHSLTKKIKEILISPSIDIFKRASTSSDNIIHFLKIKEILNENRELKKRVSLLKKEVITLKEVQLENERLYKLLGFKRRHKFKTVACKIIGKDPSNWLQTIIVDKGKDNGIKEGDAVISYSGLVGKVIEVDNSISKILLITDPSLKVAARIQRTRDEGLVEGLYRNLCRMKYLPLEAKILKGDKVITSGFSQIFPEGILIGEVVEIDKDPSCLYQVAIIKPEVKVNKLEEVLCIQDAKSF